MEYSSRYLNIRLMTALDLPSADALRASAGWNQTIDDWNRFLGLEPTGCFIAEWEGKLVGTATTIVYGPELAWIGMLLVHPEYRLRGIGSILFERCLQYLRGEGVRCIKLDATPSGKEIYSRIGFQEEWTLTRWEKVHAELERKRLDSRIIPWRKDGEINSLDARVFGVSRQRLISSLAGQNGSGFFFDGGQDFPGGFGLLRPGARAIYLGPIVADSSEIAFHLIEALLELCAGQPCYWDIPDQNAAATNLAQARGFKRQRSLSRMYLGDNLAPGEPMKQFAIAGPEVG